MSPAELIPHLRRQPFVPLPNRQQRLSALPHRPSRPCRHTADFRDGPSAEPGPSRRLPGDGLRVDVPHRPARAR